MKTILVRVWKVIAHNSRYGEIDELTISYPEGNNGYDLIVCLKCGKVHAASVAKQVYVGPSLEEKIKASKCAGCGHSLLDGWSRYPDRYIGHTGEILEFSRPLLMPDLADSLVQEFPDLYS